MYRAIDEEDRKHWEEDLRPYVEDSAKHFAYRLRGEEPGKHVTAIGRLMEGLASDLPAKYHETRAYQVLCRVLSEHFVVVSHVAMRRFNDELRAQSIQSPDDLEATCRKKAGRGHWGYVANITETCDDDNKLQLIVDVAVAPNSTDDGQMLVEARYRQKPASCGRGHRLVGERVTAARPHTVPGPCAGDDVHVRRRGHGQRPEDRGRRTGSAPHPQRFPRARHHRPWHQHVEPEQLGVAVASCPPMVIGGGILLLTVLLFAARRW
jgi:hypothetical protein